MSQLIITPDYFKLPALKKNLLVFFSLNHFYSYREISGNSKVKSYGPVKKYDLPDNSETSVIGGCIGASYSALILENAIQSGVKNVTTFGTCGYCGTGEMGFGELVSSKKAFDETGLAKAYGYIDEFIELNPIESVYSSSGIVSINSLYRVTDSDVQRWREKKIELMDMEAAALSAVAKFRGISLQQLFVISDIISDSFRWQPGFKSNALKVGIEKGLSLLKIN